MARNDPDDVPELRELHAARTEIATLRAQLREEAERRDASFTRNRAVKLIIDPKGGGIVDANPAAATFYGYSVEQLRRMNIADINMLPAELVHREMGRASLDHQQFEFRHRLASGEVRDVEVLTGPYPMDGREMLFSIIHDITERTRLAEQLLQAQKMEALGRLAGGVAHDFNNLLTAVLCFSDVALTRLELDSPARSSVEEIRKAGDRAATLTRQLLAFSRKQIMHPSLLDSNQVVREMATLLRPIVGDRVQLELDLASELGAVIADRGQIEQVLLNLVLNARDAMPEGGRLTVATGEHEVPAILDASMARLGIDSGTYVQIRVTDTGVGIPLEVMPRIFEPFYSTKHRGAGIGLGLATAYGIVRQSGGAIAVETAEGQGSTFRVLLPRVERGAHVPVQKISRARTAGGSETILLVEDDVAIRHVTTRILAAHGYCVLAAADGEDALETAARHEGGIDLLLTDVVMPRMSGRELVDAMLERRPGLKVLYMSGYVDTPMVERDLRDAGAAFLPKPFTLDALAEKVRAVLDARPTAGSGETG